MTKEQLKIIFRWAVMAPGAILAYIVTYFALIILNNITMAFYADPNSIVTFLFTTMAANGASGYAFVYVASYIAPVHKKNIAIIFAGISIFIIGAFITFGLMTSNYFDIFQLIFAMVGAIAAGYQIYTDKTEIVN